MKFRLKKSKMWLMFFILFLVGGEGSEPLALCVGMNGHVALESGVFSNSVREPVGGEASFYPETQPVKFHSALSHSAPCVDIPVFLKSASTGEITTGGDQQLAHRGTVVPALVPIAQPGMEILSAPKAMQFSPSLFCSILTSLRTTVLLI